MKISRNTKIGFVFLTSIVILIVGINYLKGINFFKPQKSYYVVYNKIDGLVASSPITINGFQVGTVKKIHLDPKNNQDIVANFNITNEKVKIPINSVAKIYSSDLMGTKAIEIIFADTNVFHSIGDTLSSAIEESLQERVSLQMLPVKNKAEELMIDMQKAIAVINTIFNEKAKRNLTKSFASIKATLDHLESSSITLDTLLLTERSKLNRIFTNIDSITINLKNNNEKLTNIFSNLESITDSLTKADLVKTINNANIALSQANTVLEKVNNSEGTIGLLLNDKALYNNLENASKDLDILLKDIRLNPKRYIHFSLIDVGRTTVIEEEIDISGNNKNSEE